MILKFDEMSQKINIAFCIYSLRAGGAERVLSIIANRLAQKSLYQISIFTFTHQNEKPFYLIHKNIQMVHLLRAGVPPIFSNKLCMDFLGLWNLWKLIPTAKPDVIISFMDSSNILSILIARIISIKVIVSERCDPSSYPRNWTVKLLRWLTYPWAHKIIVQSSSVARFFGSSLKDKIQMIGNPVPKFKKTTSQEVESGNITAISVGRLIPSKRMDMVIRAFKKVNDQYPRVKLIILGDGPERSALEKMVIELGLGNKVQLLGTVSNIEKFLIKGQIFIFASESEGFPNALCEAMSSGLVPVITDYGSSSRDIIKNGKNGIIVEKHDIKGIEESVKQLIEDKILRKSLSAEALKISETYSIHHIVDQWEGCINSVISLKRKNSL